MNDVRALGICYRLLSRMDEKTQDATLKWLHDRLQSDRLKAIEASKSFTGPDKMAIRKIMGDAAMSLMALINITGAKRASRPVTVRGPTDFDVRVSVQRAGEQST